MLLLCSMRRKTSNTGIKDHAGKDIREAEWLSKEEYIQKEKRDIKTNRQTDEYNKI